MKKGNVYFVEIKDTEKIQNILQGTKLSVSREDGEALCSDNTWSHSKAAVSGRLFAGLFWRPVQSVILKRDIILRLYVRISKRQNSCRSSFAAFRLMPRLYCVKNHMWSM